MVAVAERDEDGSASVDGMDVTVEEAHAAVLAVETIQPYPCVLDSRRLRVPVHQPPCARVPVRRRPAGQAREHGRLSDAEGVNGKKRWTAIEVGGCGASPVDYEEEVEGELEHTHGGAHKKMGRHVSRCEERT